MENLGRKLGGMERLFYEQNMIGSSNMTSILFYEGDLDLTSIPKALERLHRAYPSLTSTIVADPEARFVPAEGTLPFVVIPREDDEHFRRLARSEVRRQYDLARIFFTFLIGKGKGEIILAVDHVLMDAKSLYAVCQHFIAAMHGREQTYVPRGGPWEDRLPKAFKGWSKLPKYYKFIRKILRDAPERSLCFGHDVKHVSVESFGFQLDKAFLKDLKLATDRRQTNLNAIFSAAAILSAHEIFGQSEPGTVCLNTPVSVREQMIPKASPEEMGMFLGAFLQWQKLSAKPDIWELSRNILTNLREGVSAGDAILLGKLAGNAKRAKRHQEDKSRERFAHSITVSNPGRLEPFENLPNARIVGYRNLGSLWTQESITVVVLGYGDYLYVDAEVSIERLGHFPNAAQSLAEGIRERIFDAVRSS